MVLNMLKGKIHRATVVQAELNYVGSITIDEDLMDSAGILEYEKVEIVDVDNGNRFATYVIAGERGSGLICLNGAAARHACVGDRVIIMSFAQMTPEEAEALIAEGKADLISVARQNIADPYFARKAQAGLDYEIDPCIRCLKCYHRRDLLYTSPTCSVNPLFGMESNWSARIRKTDSPKKVAVIGGGPAGMKAAVTAAKMGHQVTLYEKESSLGGTLRFAPKDDDKKDIARLLKNLAVRCEKNGVEILLNTEATPEMIALGNYSAVLACVGADPLVMAISRQGKKVTVLEMTDELAVEAERFPRAVILKKMKEYGVDARPGHTCTAIENGVVKAVDQNNIEHSFPADSVVYAVGMRPRRELAESFIGLSDYYNNAGDCVRAAAIREAIRDGYFMALDIDRF